MFAVKQLLRLRAEQGSCLQLLGDRVRGKVRLWRCGSYVIAMATIWMHSFAFHCMFQTPALGNLLQKEGKVNSQINAALSLSHDMWLSDQEAQDNQLALEAR